MASILLAMVIALAVAHTLPDLGRLRQFGWLAGWARMLSGMFESQRWWDGGLGVLLLVGLPVLALFGLSRAVDDVAFGLAGVALAAAALFYCWGPRDLAMDVDAIAHAPDAERRRSAVLILAPGQAEASLSGTALVDAVFRAGLVRWFGVLLWFVLLGPAGALLYRTTQLIARSASFDDAVPKGLTAAAEQFARLLDWPAAHLMTLALAIAADFDAVASAWRDWHANRADAPALDTGFLKAAARASVEADLEIEDEYVDDARGPITQLQEAMALVWRVLLVWGVVFALFVLAGKIT